MTRLTPVISVVVCTRNPEPDTFARVLECLALQTLPKDRWELVVIDNGSKPPVVIPAVDGLPKCRLIAEPTPGIAAARVRGIREAAGELLVFVDDDNLLDPDYLENAVRIADSFPQLGAFGGRITADGDLRLPSWLEPFRSHLALAECDRDEWALRAGESVVVPYGAGLCVRRAAALHWATDAGCATRREKLNNRPGALRVSEDDDLVMTCLDQGLGAGRFRALHLQHVIQASRLGYAYQRRLARDIGYSYGRLLALRGRSSRGRRMIALGKTVLAFLGVKHRGRTRKLDVAYHYGYWRGLCSDCS
ncbi:MAG: glycosyltransferase [Pirellulales bacterium]